MPFHRAVAGKQELGGDRVGKKIRALSLLSGGLDSLLAIRMLEEQGIEVVGLTFTTPFFGSENAEDAAKKMGIPLRIVDISDEHLAMVKNPPHGRGKNMNPCIDCHAMMIRKAGEIAEAEGFDIVATGEVLNERPMSQNRQSLDTVAKNSGCSDILLRPLSARLLDPTKPEREGLIDRSRLGAISGRSRKPQMELAKKYGIVHYVQPAGGCLLTDPAFSKRLEVLLHDLPEAGCDDVELLKLGRFFRFENGVKAIVGRNEKNNQKIEALPESLWALLISNVLSGPAAIVLSPKSIRDVNLVASICATYADHGGSEVPIKIRYGGRTWSELVSPVEKESFLNFLI